MKLQQEAVVDSLEKHRPEDPGKTPGHTHTEEMPEAIRPRIKFERLGDLDKAGLL